MLKGKDDVTKIWSLMMDEAAGHYIQYQVGHGVVYAAIGRKMICSYPRIKMEGKKPYVRTLT